jgi:hypothetical protein
MKQLETVSQAVIEITAEKIAEIKANINLEWDNVYTKEELVTKIEMGYIFGQYAQSEHYSKEFISGLVDEVDLEKNPLPEPEPVIEETDVIPEEPTIP